MNLIPFSFVDKDVNLQLCGLKLISAIGPCMIRKCDQEKGRHLDEFRGSEALLSEPRVLSFYAHKVQEFTCVGPTQAVNFLTNI